MLEWRRSIKYASAKGVVINLDNLEPIQPEIIEYLLHQQRLDRANKSATGSFCL